jgi:glycosyltransferase involved in cell wall biosynthesis
LKILMLTDYFYPHVGGGVEKVVYEVSKRLVSKGLKVTVVTLDTSGAGDLEVLDGIRIRRCRARNLTGVIGAPLALSPSAPMEILKVCRMENPDIIHANHCFYFTTVCAMMLKHLVGKPLVNTFHIGPAVSSSRLLRPAIKIYENVIGRLIARASDRIIAVSRAVKEHAVTELGAKPDKVTVVPNGIDLCEFKPNDGTDSSSMTRVVFVGRLVYSKGMQFVVEAAPSVLSDHPNTEFIIVGDGPYRGHLIEMTRKLGMDHVFKFLGIVPSVADVLRGGDIYVRPSLMEGMPLTVLEAMACGLPVVASNVAGTPEVLTNGETGILVEPGNVEQLAKAINRLLDDRKYARRIGDSARRFVKQHYSWERTVQLTLRVYEELM